MGTPGSVIAHPNRERASSRATRAVLVLVLLASALLMLVVTVGGWSALEGARALQIGYIVVYLLVAALVARWKRGLLPVAGALAAILLIFAAVSGPAWLDRDRDGFTDPALDSSLLGLLTLLLVPLQVLVVAFTTRGFRQRWNVEVEPPAGEPGRGRPRAGSPAAA